MKKVELLPAMFFYCEECARENYIRATLVPMKFEDVLRHAEASGVDPDLLKGVMTVRAPKVLKCQFCQEEFEPETAASFL